MPAENTTYLVVNESEKFKVAQAIYNAVTGKTEKLTRVFHYNFKIKITDFFQLNAKCEQMCAQWNVIQKNCNITVHHIDDNKEEFSSFERFKLYDSSQTSPVESVTFQHNTLLALPNVEKPQPYRITIRLLSRVAMIKKMDTTSPMAAFSEFRFFGGSTATIEIEYVDYVVARNMLSTFDSWAAQIETSPKNKFLTFIQRKSHYIPGFSKSALILVSGIACFGAAKAFLSAKSDGALQVEFLLLVFILIFLVSEIANFVGSWIESSVDSITTLSFIHLNKGDERLIADFERTNNTSLTKSIGGVVLLLIEGISIDIMAELIIKKFLS